MDCSLALSLYLARHAYCYPARASSVARASLSGLLSEKPTQATPPLSTQTRCPNFPT
jgi:hypothetical protein